MSEGFELGPFHVPQQSRRDKLRSLEGGTCSSPGLHPLYELTCHHGDAILHHHPSLPPPVKQENSFNLMMGFAPAPDRTVDLPHFSLSSSTPSPSHHHLVDLPPSLPLNPNTTYICPPQDSSHNFRNFEQPLLDSSRPPSFHIPQNSGIMTQGLSLSLSPQTFNREASVIPADKAMDSYIVIGGGGDVSRSIGPLGPFTGYAEVLKGSRFLKPAQQLLEASCDVGQRAYMEGISAADVEVDRLINTVIAENPSGIGSSGGDHGEHHRRKTRLVSMLNEVCRGYKYYYQQMQAVVASFESVHGLNKAVPFTPLALKTLSRNFRNLKNAIATQLRSTCKARVADSSSKDDESQFRVAEQNLEHQRIAQASSVYEQPHVWRPQRGLPERAVSLLRAWLYEHFLHPYPTDSDKHMLAKQTGLSRNQVSNWFINARVRLWKPMVEEIHMLEMRQSQKAHECRDQDVNKQGSTSNMQSLRSHELFQANTGRNDRKSCAENQPGHQELSGLPSNGAEPINFSYDNIPAQRNSAIQVGVGHQMGGGNAGISLTLGLHQGNGACLPESYPLSVAHFGLGGLGSSSTSYAGFGGITGQIRHFDGQLLHDFVG